MKISQFSLVGVLIMITPLASQAVELAVAPATEQIVTIPVDEGLTNGIVKRIDAEQGKITINHEALDNLGMPAMTMVFRVAEPAMMDKLKKGNHVRFRVEKTNGVLTIVHMEPAA